MSTSDRRYLKSHHVWRQFLKYYLLIIGTIMFALIIVAALNIPTKMDQTTLGRFVLGVFMASVIFGTGYRFMVVPVRWFCHACGKRLHANEPWRCGFCDAENHKRSFLDRCENRNCEATPKAFECPECGACTFLTRECDPQRAARSLVAKPKLPIDDIARQERVRELEEREHEKRKLELEIDLAKLRLKLDPPKPEKVDPLQKRIDWVSHQIDAAVIDCKSIAQCKARKAELIQQIKNDPSVPENERSGMEDIIMRQFDSIELSIQGGDIRI